MRGLNVYCCPNCGHYGFFQLVANAVCPDVYKRQTLLRAASLTLNELYLEPLVPLPTCHTSAAGQYILS